LPSDKKDTEVEIKLITTKETPAVSQRIGFNLHEEAPKTGDETTEVKQGRAIFPTSIPLRGELLRGTSLLDESDCLWITVMPAK
jgi:hypothetical protein